MSFQIRTGDRIQEQAPKKLTYKRLTVASYRAILYRVSQLILDGVGMTGALPFSLQPDRPDP